MPKAALKSRESHLAENRVNLAIDMTDTCVRACADSIKDKTPTIKEEEILDQIRKRIKYGRRIRGV